MKKSIKKVLALTLAAAMTLSACGGGGSDTKEPAPATSAPATTTSEKPAEASAKPEPAPAQPAGEEIKDLVIPILSSRELETFNILYSQRAADYENLANLTDSLLEIDIYGALQPGIAESWGSDDGGITWKFNLRQGVKWVDVNGNEKGETTAHDFATGLEWVLNFHKNDSTNTSMPIEMIKGASEYYEWTKTLSADDGNALLADEGSKFFEMVGCEVPDDYTIIYTCITNKPYFDSVAVYSCLYPISQAMIDELGGPTATRAMNNENMWYNGCYTMTRYVQGNEKIFTKNPLYWDTECTLFDTVTYKLVESNDVAYQLYEAGEIDYVLLTESNVNNIYNNENHKFHDYMVSNVPSKYSYQIHFNYNKNTADGTPDTNWNTAIANTAFRRSIYYGLDLVEYYKRTNAINPLVCENNFYTMRGLVYDSTGKDYVELVREEMGLPQSDGEKMARLDTTKAADYKKQAMEELSALGVTFPVIMDYPISASSQTALDTANVLKQSISDSLGDDFIQLNIITYVSSLRKEIADPSLHGIVINGWGADYGDPQNYLGQETYGYDNAYYSTIYSKIYHVTEETEANKELLDIYKEYTKLVEEADAITTDMDARYKAYAKAEAYMLDNALVVPCYYNIGWALSKYEVSSRLHAMFGCQNDKMKNWKTNANGYTTEEAAALEAAKAAAVQ